MVIMQDTTELQAPPAGFSGFPPPPPVRPVHATPPNQINQAAPSLPTLTPAVPRPQTPPDANPFSTSMNQHWAPASAPPGPKRRSPGRRIFKWLVVLAILAGAVYAGVTYGPDLMNLASDDDAIDEPTAPLVFPTPTAAPTPFRTATFTVERPDSLRGLQRFEVTADFETGVSQVMIDRSDAPDLEVLTLWDQAFIRRVDEGVWYQLDRGQFLDGADSGMTRWIRTLDQLLPPALRTSAVIDRATRSTVGTEATTRLLVSIDPADIARATAAPAPPPPAADGTPTPPPAEPTPQLPPGLVLQPGTDEEPTLTMEIWVDGAGIVRKSIVPIELGAETITVTSVSTDEWLPQFPTPETVQPFTASALSDLGL
jgi:hypothetical protein